ncbi:MAG: efflux RND transporter permease subunit [Treponema sp.]|nr:efflux RND transporter permease subunit [Treponema sp.]MCL2272368.1 efflux RND transporter permease subunit [Treponema sp.]
MTALSLWMERKKAALCILICILSVSLAVIANSRSRIAENNGGAYAVKIRHYGIDAPEIERSITIPLEDALSAIPGVLSVISSSENSLCSVFIRFKPGGRGRYEAVRDAAQKVYETLPSSVQRPEILSTNNSRIPVWSASVFPDNLKENILNIQTPESFLEKILKPRLESLEGTGEVIVSGTGLKQIFIIIDQEKISSIGLDSSAVTSFLAMNDSIFPGGSITHRNREIIFTVDGRHDLEKALVPLGEGKYIELCEIAQIIEKERTPDILSRLNGKKTAAIAVMGRYGADLRKLSADIKKELSLLSIPGEIVVLSDLGAEEAAAFHSVLKAALSGAFMTAIICFFLNRKTNCRFAGFPCALTIPLICIVSAAVLSAAGFAINRLMLAGIAAGVGTAIDSVILCAEKISENRDSRPASEALSQLANPLIAGAATTVAALLPLTTIEDNGAKIIASAVAVITIASLVISLTLLPPLLLWKVKPAKKRQFFINELVQQPRWLSKLIREFYFIKCFYITPAFLFLSCAKLRLSRIINRFLAANARFCFRYPLRIVSVSFTLALAAIILLFIKGADMGNSGSEDSLYAQVEFDGGLLAEETDRLLASYSEQLVKNSAIKNVETGARTGSGSLLVSFDPKKTKPSSVRDLARSIPIPGGFVFFPENSARDRYWEIKIYGDEDQKCREIAREFAHISASHSLIKERVLNFKQDGKKMILLPDRETLAELGITFSSAALTLRQGVYGPVAYKKTDENGETDVRILTAGMDFPGINSQNVMRQTKEGTLGLLVPAVNENADGSLTAGSVAAGFLMRIKEEIEPSSIRRDNRRRTASITITTKPMDARRVKSALSPLFKNLDLPPGYSIEFDPDAVKQAEDLSSTVLSLLTAILFCYMIMACINESFIIPLIVLAAIPPSLSIPALCLGFTGGAYNLSAACAFIAVSGMTVNAAILCVDSLRRANQNGRTLTPFVIYFSLRKKLPVLLSTTITTITCALPFLFLGGEANAFIKTMSLTGALGVASSCFFAITLIPSLFIIIKKLPICKSILPAI